MPSVSGWFRGFGQMVSTAQFQVSAARQSPGLLIGTFILF
jgi:hypothetical protein